MKQRNWNTALLTSAALGMALGPQALWANPAQPQVWAVADTASEAGEAGAVADASAEVAYLGQLGIVSGHLRAARDLYAKGQIDDAIGLSYHPEAEMMDAVRADLAAAGQPDITPLMTAFSAAMEAGAPQADVDAALADLTGAVRAIVLADAPRARIDAAALLAHAAANEYAGSITGGAVSDILAYHESYAFIQIAQDWLGDLGDLPAARKAIAALGGASEAFGDMTTMDLPARDPAILAVLAARVELYASQVR